MKNILAIIIVFIVANAQAQTVSRQLIGTTGGNLSNANIDLNFSAGEAVITTLTSGSMVLTQGFHQTDEAMSSLDELDVYNDISVYPNPTSGPLTIGFSDQVSMNGTFHVKIYDIQGQLVFQGEESGYGQSIKLDVSQLTIGHYQIHFTDAQGVLSRAKFVKH